MTQETKTLALVGIITLLLTLGVVFLLSRGGNSADQKSKPIDGSLLIRDYSPKIASPSAKITLVEFADFQCPFCGQVHPMIKQIEADYLGKVNIVFRNFPLSQHQNALKAAMVGMAAHNQGKFWQMYDLLYQNQKAWSELSDPNPLFTTYARQINLDQDQFQKDLSNSDLKNKIDDDVTDALKLGVNSTPTFFINGSKYTGNLDYQGFKSALDKELDINP